VKGRTYKPVPGDRRGLRTERSRTDGRRGGLEEETPTGGPASRPSLRYQLLPTRATLRLVTTGSDLNTSAPMEEEQRGLDCTNFHQTVSHEGREGDVKELN